MEVRLGTIKKPKFLPTYIISAVIFLVIFTFLALFTLLGAYMDFVYNALELGSFIKADNELSDTT